MYQDYISSETGLWITLLGSCICWYAIGKIRGSKSQEEVIDSTITYLIHENFIRWKRDENGEIEILTIDEKNHN